MEALKMKAEIFILKIGFLKKVKVIRKRKKEIT